MPHIKTYKVIPWTIDHKVLNPIYRVTVRYNPKNIKMIIAINGPLKIRKKMKLFSGKYQCPRRIENDASMTARRITKSSTNKVSCLLNFDRLTSFFNKTYQ